MFTWKCCSFAARYLFKSDYDPFGQHFIRSTELTVVYSLKTTDLYWLEAHHKGEDMLLYIGYIEEYYKLDNNCRLFIVDFQIKVQTYSMQNVWSTTQIRRS